MKTIRITGANSGIGKALAFLTAKNQHRLILLVRKESDITHTTKSYSVHT